MFESGVGLSRSWVAGGLTWSGAFIGPGWGAGATAPGDPLGRVGEPVVGDDCPAEPYEDPLVVEGEPFGGIMAPYLDVPVWPPCHGAKVDGWEVDG